MSGHMGKVPRYLEATMELGKTLILYTPVSKAWRQTYLKTSDTKVFVCTYLPEHTGGISISFYMYICKARGVP